MLSFEITNKGVMIKTFVDEFQKNWNASRYVS